MDKKILKTLAVTAALMGLSSCQNNADVRTSKTDDNMPMTLVDKEQLPCGTYGTLRGMLYFNTDENPDIDVVACLTLNSKESGVYRNLQKGTTILKKDLRAALRHSEIYDVPTLNSINSFKSMEKSR